MDGSYGERPKVQELRKQAGMIPLSIILSPDPLRKNKIKIKHQSYITIEQLRLKEELLSRLASVLLPQLRLQCTSLSHQYAELSYVPEAPESTVKLISEIQANLHLNLAQIIQTINQLIPYEIPAPENRTHDQDFNRLKIYRIYRLNHIIRNDLKIHLESLFRKSIQILREFGISSHEEKHTNTMESILIDISEAIDSAIEPARQPQIELGRALIPIFKLSRLFFKKLQQEKIEKKGAGLFTEMCSSQLYSLERSIRGIPQSISSLRHTIQDAGQSIPVSATASQVMSKLRDIIDYFQSFIFLIHLYVLPNLFPPDNSSNLSSQLYFQKWCVTWTTLLLKAAYNATQAAQSFIDG
ncbi:uncharacterized protein PGTG_18925 [Puccinia graminis f. sp. tritici CRL 75-36-700-3]|uniref:Uncharacterized protein n=1 Tax=Puccinia graminis f. sp. tritici (strain CRL 75-36-700-3 / race SCCL) TaxID=418459 RepID=E3LAD6_PUCGT|nr:uncharacterized protein PGTG_18925 [Puccinia graminis f. sp. tritici CRL 75-36-700-3]EFP93511.1 hypothetical protein PGTG_18925 [Puccinia graminis f. sp. tritici CRL 75-36-700-3]